MPKVANKPAPATATPKAAPAKAAPAKPTKPAFSAAIGDVIVFTGYETPPKEPLLIEGEFVRVTNIDETKKKRVRYHVEPIQADGEGNPRSADTAFAEELRTPTAQEAEEVAAFLAHEEDDAEDLTALAELADAEEDSEEKTAAQARLTELAAEAGINVEEYPDWAAIADALTPEDLAGLAALADSEDGTEGKEEAAARLTEVAAENDVDPEAFGSWADVVSAIEGTAPEEGEEQAPEEAPEEPAPAATAAKGKPGAKAPAKPGTVKPGAKKENAKKSTTGTKAPKLILTDSINAVMAEVSNDLLAAMRKKEADIGQSFLDLGGLIKLGEMQNAHLQDIDPETGKPRFEASKKGYYQWVAANLDTEERVARHLAKIYYVFIAKLKFEGAGLVELGISRLREIAPVALKLAKEDKETNAALKEAGKEESSDNLTAFLQEAAGLTVRDVVAKVRAYKAPAPAGEGAPAGAAGVINAKVITLTYRVFEDKAAFIRTVLDAAMTDLPDAEKNAENALFRVFTSYAENAGMPAFTPAKPAKPAPSKVGAKAPAAKAPAPAAKPAPAKKAPAAPAKK